MLFRHHAELTLETFPDILGSACGAWNYCLFMATNPEVDANLASADDLLVRLLEHVKDNRSADLQLVALTAQALASVALVRAATELVQALINRDA
jgi:hypothetical protein